MTRNPSIPVTPGGAGAAGPIVGLGEVLWDLFPAGEVLGGAPFNFAFHCHQLGRLTHPAGRAVMLSRVGADARGEGVRRRFRELGLTDDHLQTDPQRPTGTVGVSVGADGQPAYVIHEGAAWDAPEWGPQLEGLLTGAQAVCFGTLAQRTPAGAEFVRRALKTAANALIICDVNLRQQFWTPEVIEESLLASRWAKLNEDELQVLRDELRLRGRSAPGLLASLRNRYQLQLVALTRGEKGCLVQTADEEVSVSGVKVTVADTVGAGDAFTAGLLAGVLAGQGVGEAAVFANRLAAQVAAEAGGTPVLNPAELPAGWVSESRGG